MTDLNLAIQSYLTSSSSITSLVSTRVRPDVLDDGETMPAIVFWRVAGQHESEINGSLAGIAEARVTIQAYSESRKTANQVAEAIRLLMVDMRGTRSGVQIRNVLVDSGQQHFPVFPTDKNASVRYVTAQDFRINFVEDV